MPRAITISKIRADENSQESLKSDESKRSSQRLQGCFDEIAFLALPFSPQYEARKAESGSS
jgi:hypothetical protein